MLLKFQKHAKYNPTKTPYPTAKHALYAHYNIQITGKVSPMKKIHCRNKHHVIHGKNYIENIPKIFNSHIFTYSV